MASEFVNNPCWDSYWSSAEDQNLDIRHWIKWSHTNMSFVTGVFECYAESSSEDDDLELCRSANSEAAIGT